MQWHPLFAELLRPLVESCFEVLTNVPVGDAPRLADLVLLRRTSSAALPFLGMWRWLTPWNVVEFKGPTVSARVGDLDLLIELGLGIHRRLNEERRKQGERPVGRGDVSFWYLANHLGRRFLSDARALVGDLEALGSGVWRVRHLGRSLILVSNRDVPVERDSIPVHLLVREPLDATRNLAREIASQADLWQLYGPWLATMFPKLWKEAKQMARRAKQGPVFDFRPVIEEIGLEGLIRQIGLKRMIEEMGPQRVIKEVGLKELVAKLTPEQREELRRLLK